MLMETPIVRLTARMDMPSTSSVRAIVRLAVDSLFIVNDCTCLMATHQQLMRTEIRIIA